MTVSRLVPFRRVVALVAAALLAVGGAQVVTAAPAQAATCYTGTFCIWDAANYTGAFASFGAGVGDGAGTEFWSHPNAFINQRASSVWNRTNYTMDLLDWGWRSCHYGGGWVTVPPGQKRALTGSGENNTASCLNNVFL